jgi:hypothetical protein
VKRVVASVLVAVALAACGGPLAKPETPQQALSAAAQRASQLKSARFDFSGNVQMTLPSSLSQMFGESGSNGTLTVNASGTGAAEFPDRYQASITVKMSNFQVATDVIVAGGKAYVKNPLTGKWQLSSGSQNFSDQLGEPDPLTYDQFLKNVKAVKDLGDTTLSDGTSVHHYLLTPDKAKLLASLESSSAAAKNPQALAALTQVLNSGTMTIEVWFGKSDHLVRRLQTNADYTIDLNQLMSSLGSAGSGSRLPGGSTIHAVATATINYHDFDTPVTIAIPAVS